jgi:hypothetical protein
MNQNETNSVKSVNTLQNELEYVDENFTQILIGTILLIIIITLGLLILSGWVYAIFNR